MRRRFGSFGLILAMSVCGSGTALAETPAVSRIAVWEAGVLADRGRADHRAAIHERVTLPDGEALDLELHRFRITGPSTRFVIGQIGGPDLPLDFDPAEISLFRGHVVGRPGSDVYLGLSPGASRGFINLGSGAGMYHLSSRLPDGRALSPGRVAVLDAASVPTYRPEVPYCAVEATGLPAAPEDLSASRGATSLGGQQIEIALETDYELFQLFGDTSSTLAYIMELFGAVSHIFQRDVNAYYEITFVRLWITPNDLFNQPDPFGSFINYWNANMGGVHRDVAQFVSGRRDFPYGGIASLSSLCSGSGYSVVGYLAGRLPDAPNAAITGSFDIGVVAHELGHNCSAFHTHDYTPPIDQCFPGPSVYTRGEIMSYCSQSVSGADYVTDLRFTTRIQNEIRGFVGASSCVADDCNFNGILDATDISGGTSVDANFNGRPDECEDCNGNGVLDPADIAGGTSADVGGNGIPDECEPDCNGNFAPDAFDIASGTSSDLYLNGIPDECDPDCNNNATPDYNELQAVMSRDVNRNTVLDICEDCDADGTTDAQELAGAHHAWVGSSSLMAVGQYHSLTGVLVQNSDIALGGGAQDVLVLADGRVLASHALLDRVVAFEPVDGTLLGDFVVGGAGGLDFPTGLALRANGNLLVSSRNTGQVLEYDGASGAFVDVFVEAGPDGPVMPYGLAFGPSGNLFVACDDSQIREYHGSTGAFVRLFVPAAGNGGLSQPRGLTFKADGHLVAAGFGNGAVLEYHGETGAFIRRFDRGTVMYGPWGIRVGPDGDVYVTRDFAGRNHTTTTRIYQLDPRSGNLVRSYLIGDDTGLFNPTGFAFAPGWQRDCNVNFRPDNCDIADGVSLDADADGVPDECEVDCNGNGTQDRRDIVPFGGSLDCNFNRRPDECDLASGESNDCNSNGRPDECETDCNTNALADECDIAAGTSLDQIGAGGVGDGVPDECQLDCNGNLTPDELDIVGGVSRDCNANTRPDECDIAGGASLDCNTNTRPDECDLAGGTSRDCNANARPDECDIAGGTSQDCATDGTPDECESDCNLNRIEDLCDVAQGTSADCNTNVVPDECESQADCNGNGAQDICDTAFGSSSDCNGNERPDECELDPDGAGATFLVPLADLVNVPVDCGGGPFSCAVAAQQGFRWTDPSTAAPLSVRVEFNVGVNCHNPGTTFIGRLNGLGGPVFALPANHCSCSPTLGALVTLNVNPDFYLPGGVNTFTIINGSTCLGFAPRAAWSGAFARITVTRVGDCNVNGTPDDCDIASGTSTDLNGNTLPDDCEDCNGNGAPDDLDIALGTSLDCNRNDAPDECEPGGTDCNANGTLDECDLAAEVSNDCNGNGLPDSCDIASGVSQDANANGVADECDTPVCHVLWAGFEPAPPFGAGSFLDGLDSDGDGSAWANPTNSWSVATIGCPSGQGKAIKGVSQTPPTTDFVQSEYFRTVNGALDCGAAIWALTFDARSEALLNPRIDWQMTLRDGSSGQEAVLLHWASTQSSYPGVTAAQGGTGRGRLLVKNPAGSPAFINSGFALPANSCYQVRVELNNVTNQVRLFINGTLRVTTTRLGSGCRRLDRLWVGQVANGQTTGGTNRLGLDNFELCQTGAALSWPDCNANCQSDTAETESGRAHDCNANAVPDSCEITAGTLPDANANGIADGCMVEAASRKTHAGLGARDVSILATGRVQNGSVSTEPRLGGVSELRLGFDGPPGGPGIGPVTVFRQTCGPCPCGPGSPIDYAPTGIVPSTAVVEGNDLVLTFEPGLPGPATYRVEVSAEVAGFAGGAMEVRSLVGDINGDARTNATDRSMVIGVWTDAGFSPQTDVNLSGATNGHDRSVVIGQWTSPQPCAP